MSRLEKHHGKRRGIVRRSRALRSPATRKNEENAFRLVSIGRPVVLYSRSGHKNPKGLFVLDISRERVVSYEVVHGDEGKRWFSRIRPRNGSTSNGVGVVIGSWVRWSGIGRIAGDGRYVT